MAIPMVAMMLALALMAAMTTLPAQRPSQAVSGGRADDHTNGTYGVVLAASINIMGKTLQ